MKYLFVICLSLLIIASIATAQMSPEAQSDIPILYWITDPNPARELQIKTFKGWLKKNGYPEIKIELDTANQSGGKVEIQGVSGVCSTIIGHCGGKNMRFRQKIGMLVDITDVAKKMGFGVDKTYKAMEPELTVNGRQYGFPCNVSAIMCWINKDTLAKYGLKPPAGRWTLDEFEEFGKKFVAAANKPGEPNKYFLVDNLDLTTLLRSVGVSTYNETLTKCGLNKPELVDIMKRIYKWTYEDRIIPSQADKDSFATDSGYGGQQLQLFNSGNYAMFRMGRYALIQLRKFGKVNLAVCEPPHGGFPNTMTSTRAAAIYAGASKKNKDLAKYFLAYLASEDYNMNIVEDADALPPNPEYTRIEAFLKPPKYPNEWGCHKAFADAVENIAIAPASSPFALDSTVARYIKDNSASYMSKVITAEEAAKVMELRVNEEIERTVSESAELQKLYEEKLKQQAKIDQLKKEGKKIPLELIDNVFLKRYYVFKGWAE